MRRSYLYAFLDDASRLLLYGSFFFKGDFPALEPVFKRSLQRYKVSPVLAKKRVEVRYDPERLEQIEIYFHGVFKQRAKPLQIEPNQAPKKRLPLQQYQKPEKITDYLGWITNQHKAKIKITHANGKISEENQTIAGFLHILGESIPKEVFDEKEAVAFFQTFGPFDRDRLKHTGRSLGR